MSAQLLFFWKYKNEILISKKKVPMCTITKFEKLSPNILKFD